MIKPRILFYGDYSDPETMELLEGVCGRYHEDFDILASGYNYGEIAKRKGLKSKCETAGLKSGRFFYYRSTAEFVIITTAAAKYNRKKTGQKIIYVLSGFDDKNFLGTLGDISAFITENKDAYSHITETFNIPAILTGDKQKEVLSYLESNTVLKGRDAEEYLLVTTNIINNFRDHTGVGHYIESIIEDAARSLIILSPNFEERIAAPIVFFEDEGAVKELLEDFRGTVIFPDEASKAFFKEYVSSHGFNTNYSGQKTYEELKLRLLEESVRAHKPLEDKEYKSEYVKYRSLMEEIYSIDSCEKKKVSIIICRYNTPYDLLSRSIESALNTGHENVEVILVDDGSEDNIEQTIKADFPDGRVFYYYKQNEGLGPSRDFGLTKATGDYVFYLDSDDTIHPGGMRCMIAHADFFRLKMVIGKRIICDELGIPRKESYKQLAGDTFLCYYGSECTHHVYSDVMVNNLLIDLEFLRRSNITFRSGLYEDVEYSAQLYRFCPEFHYLNVAIHDWYKYGDSSTISSTPTIRNLTQRIEKEEFAWKYIQEKDRKDRIFTIMNSDFNLYLNAYFNMQEEQRDEVWEHLKEFFLARKEYIDPDAYPEKMKEFSRSILQDNRYRFEYVIKKFFTHGGTEESYDNYIVFTHYHLLVAILRTIASKRKSRLFVGRFYTSINNNLIYKIKNTGLFELVKPFTYGNLVSKLFNELDKRPDEADLIIPDHLYDYFRGILAECNTENDNIYIFSDTHPYWYYVEREFKNIIKLEDAYNSFDREIKTHKMTGIWAGIQKYEGTVYPLMFFRSGKISKIILSKMPEDIPEHFYEKIVIEDTKELARLHKDEMKSVLSYVYDVDESVFNKDSTMLLTQPLAQFGYCTTEEQKALMKRMCRGCDKSGLLIKPHPADTVNYRYLGGTILPKNVPIEVYNYLDVKIAKAVTFGSSAIETIEFAEEKKNYFKLHDIEFDEVVDSIKKLINGPVPVVSVYKLESKLKKTAKKILKK
ncbi:MAG: glycosyltransferase family 2 protein [Mogibacterium sp.]|nr:glycosyltransferase family 2 protein [Mogibacterium sp.]